MKVSIIIPNYNHAKYLKQRIDAVLNQTFDDYEVIILDDCSTDDSRAIIEEYRQHDKVSSIIFNETNSGGVFRQWIRGLSLASGQYVWIAESDDCTDPYFLEKTLQIMEADPNLKMVFTDSYIINEDNHIIDRNSLDKESAFNALKKDNYIINSDNLTRYLFLDMIITNASSALIDKAALLKIDSDILKTFKNTGDRFVYIGIAQYYGIRFLDEPLNYMRSHSGNTTKMSLKNGNIFRDRLEVFSYYLDGVTLNDEAKLNLRTFFEQSYFDFVDFCDFTKLDLLQKRLKDKKIITIFQYTLYNMYNSTFNHFLKKQSLIIRRTCQFLQRKLSLGRNPI
ncbi:MULTISPECIES: glycosyltransferase family 2 protein [Sphingobacterium]|uniref:Glycosyltransferase family 2 protein n=1 Tax=Sphingobacterium populi TaxID=1812824 RepID=A0ABW5UB18_9SPHI|nr:glycosyltransferase family 2 protein [Sphingobacterium sp. CFCC 11742]